MLKEELEFIKKILLKVNICKRLCIIGKKGILFEKFDNLYEELKVNF